MLSDWFIFFGGSQEDTLPLLDEVTADLVSGMSPKDWVSFNWLEA